MVDTTLIYRSFFEAAESLPDDERLAFYDAIMRYSFDDEEPDLDGIARAMFIMAKPNIDSRNGSVNAGKKGGRPRKQEPPAQEKTEGIENEKPEVTEEQKAGLSETKKGGFQEVKSKAEAEAEAEAEVDAEKRRGRSVRFSPPSVEEVRAYCRERGNHVNPEQFVAFYSSKGWKVGNQPMKDWRAAVRTWEIRDKDKPKTKNGFNRFDQREYSNDDLEQMLLGGAG